MNESVSGSVSEFEGEEDSSAPRFWAPAVVSSRLVDPFVRFVICIFYFIFFLQFIFFSFIFLSLDLHQTRDNDRNSGRNSDRKQW